MELEKFEQAEQLKNRISLLKLYKESLLASVKNGDFTFKFDFKVMTVGHGISTVDVTPHSNKIICASDKSDFDFIVSCIDKRIEELEAEFQKL